MLSSFLAVGTQVIILFILIGIGFVLGKTGKMDDRTSLGMSNLVVYVVMPAMQIVAYQRPLESKSLHNFFIVLLVATVVQIIGILISRGIIRSRDEERRRTLQFSASFSNCGFMAFPLQMALLGSLGVFYGSAYSMVFTLLAWTYGIYLLTADKTQLSWQSLLRNPGIIGSVIALVFYLGQITLPEIIFKPLEHMSHLNTPLPMVILGYQLSHADFRAVVRGLDTWLAAIMRLIISPLVAIVVCMLLHVDADVSIVIVIAASAPPASLLGILSAKFGRDTELSSGVVSFHTLLSILTMPLMVSLAQTLCK